MFALTRIQENIVEEQFSKYFAKFLGEFLSVRVHAAPVFTPARTQENTPGELFMYCLKAVLCQGVLWGGGGSALWLHRIGVLEKGGEGHTGKKNGRVSRGQRFMCIFGTQET